MRILLRCVIIAVFLSCLLVSGLSCNGSTGSTRYLALVVTSVENETTKSAYRAYGETRCLCDDSFLFTISVDRTENTIDNQVYTVSIVSGGRTYGSEDIVFRKGESSPKTVDIRAPSGQMCSDLEQECKAAHAAYDDFEAKCGWMLLTGQISSLSYEEVKKLTEQEKELASEVDRWERWVRGDVGYSNTAFDEFCKKYIQLSVKAKPGNGSSASGGQSTVLFPDPNLEAAVREAIGKPTGQIYKSQLQGVTKLWADNSGISDLTGLEYCTNLTEVKLEGNQIRDVTPLSKLTNIYALSLIDNNISDISPLLENSGLGKEDFLYLVNNPLSQDSLNTYIPDLKQRGVYVFMR